MCEILGLYDRIGSTLLWWVSYIDVKLSHYLLLLPFSYAKTILFIKIHYNIYFVFTLIFILTKNLSFPSLTPTCRYIPGIMSYVNHTLFLRVCVGEVIWYKHSLKIKYREWNSLIIDYCLIRKIRETHPINTN